MWYKIQVSEIIVHGSKRLWYKFTQEKFMWDTIFDVELRPWIYESGKQTFLVDTASSFPRPALQLVYRQKEKCLETPGLVKVPFDHVFETKIIFL